MSVYIYDNAIIEDLRLLTNDIRVQITTPERLFQTIATIDNDKIEFPIISLTRLGWQIQDKKPQMMKFDGALVDYDENCDVLKRVQAIPISIRYQLDVWTKTRLDNDNILRELIFYYSTHPTLVVNIEYGLNISHNFNIFFDTDIEDNSDITEHNNRGEYFRQTSIIYTDDAYLWKSSSRKPTYVETNIEVIEEKR